MAVSMEQVKELRERTGAGILECKKVLDETSGDVEKAIEVLRERGMAKAVKKASRDANEGLVASYIHMGGKIGTLVEVACETDFVARTEEFQTLANEIALHIAAANTSFLNREQVDQETLDREREIYVSAALEEGKPANIAEKIADGRLNKYYEENVLMEQAYVRDPSITIEELVKQKIAKLGENIVVRNFARFAIGE